MDNHSILGALQAHLMSSHGIDAREVTRLMSLSPSAVHIDRALTNLAIMYKNRELIADTVLPVVSVKNRSDKIFAFPVTTMQELADSSLASTRGMPKEISYSLTSSDNYSVTDYALMDFVSADEIANADAPLQPKQIATELVTNFLNIGREYRVANVVFNSANYGSNTAALSGTDRWDTDTSDPVQKIEDAIESCFVRPTHLVLGAQVYIKLRNHPKMLQYILSRASTTAGNVPLRVNEALIAEAFGLEGCVVGRAKYNSAAEGAAVSSGYLWGKSAALIRVEPNPNPRNTQTFGYTFRFGTMETREIPDLIRGVRGGSFIKVSHSDAEKVLGGANAGFLYTTVVS
jgi:hypothetical protein